MNIGVLYPRSAAHPGLNMEFLDGLKACLKKQGLDTITKLHAESIGFGGIEKEVYEKAEKLLVIEDVDILVAYIDFRVMAVLEPLLYASGKLMIVVNPGANYPQNWIPQPGIVYLTLQHGFSCWLSGSLAGQEKDPKAALASSFYDCGYLHTAAMVKSFVKKGGKLTFNYINQQLYDDKFEINQLTSFLSSDKGTRQLLCIFDSLPASLFYNRLNDFDGTEYLKLYVSPMMLEGKALDIPAGGYKFSIAGHLPWHACLELKRSKDFTAYYEQQLKKKLSIFSVLGWEAGLIIAEIFAKSKEDLRDGAVLVTMLKKTKLEGPRGTLILDDQTNFFLTPVYRCTIPQHADKLQIEDVGRMENEWKNFINEPSEAVSSGWTNTYLCY